MAAAVEHGIETPHPFQPAPGYFRLEGWVLITGAGAPTRTRLRIGGKLFEPQSTRERPDVAAAFPGERFAAQSGFCYVCFLPFGLHVGELEASADGVNWTRVRSLSVPVSSHPLLGAFEQPPAGTILDEPVRVQGWCFHPEFELSAVSVRFGNVEVPCEYALPRPDVGTRFPQHPRAARSGFITCENLPRGRGQIALRVETPDGRNYYLPSDLSGAISTGADAKRRPLSAVRTPLTVPAAADRRAANPAGNERPAPPPGPRNILFALYGDFTCNSALHVAALANEMIAAGYDVVVAGPEHKETITTLPRARFMALEFAELADLPELFVDHRGPALVHAWTPRENVRQFAAQVRARYDVPTFVHLEDNELAILASATGRTIDELKRMSERELDALVPPHLSHPKRAERFLREAAGVTTIVERLRELVPADRPALTFWPAADPAVFRARPINHPLRASLGIAPADTVLFYHGNVHTANAGEVIELYRAVALLNRRGVRTFLVRTGRDDGELMRAATDELAQHLIHLGFVAAARYLPDLMELADCFVQPGQPSAFNDYRFPSKLPEFFALGRPVILPRSNLGTELEHGRDAYVLDDANAPAIADAVTAIRADAGLAARLSTGALAFAERRFSWRASATHLIDFYRAHSALAARPDRI